MSQSQLNITFTVGTLTVPASTKPATKMRVAVSRAADGSAVGEPATVDWNPAAHIDLGVTLESGTYTIEVRQLDEDGADICPPIITSVALPSGTKTIPVLLAVESADVSDVPPAG